MNQPQRGPENALKKKQPGKGHKNLQETRTGKRHGSQRSDNMYDTQRLGVNTEKKHMERYRGTYDIFFEIEHRKETGRYGGEVEQREGMMRRESLTKVQAVRIANTRHVGSLWRQKHGVEVVVDKEEGAVVFIPENGRRIASPSLGECQKWVASLCWVHLALGRMDTER